MGQFQRERVPLLGHTKSAHAKNTKTLAPGTMASNGGKESGLGGGEREGLAVPPETARAAGPTFKAWAPAPAAEDGGPISLAPSDWCSVSGEISTARGGHVSRGTVSRLCRAARNRAIHLRIMPATFARRKRNTSFYNGEQNAIAWHVDWVFPKGDGVIGCTSRHDSDVVRANMGMGEAVHAVAATKPSDAHAGKGEWHQEESHSSNMQGQEPLRTCALPTPVVISQEGVNDTVPLHEHLSRLLQQRPDNFAVRLRLPSYASAYRASEGALHMLIRIEGRPASSPGYRSLPLSMALREALRGLTIVEYPTIIIADASNLERFNVVDEGAGLFGTKNMRGVEEKESVTENCILDGEIPLQDE